MDIQNANRETGQALDLLWKWAQQGPILLVVQKSHQPDFISQLANANDICRQQQIDIDKAYTTLKQALFPVVEGLPTK